MRKLFPSVYEISDSFNKFYALLFEIKGTRFPRKLKIEKLYEALKSHNYNIVILDDFISS